MQNTEIVESTKRIQKLEFVVDNWWIKPFQKKKVVYLVAAFSIDNENQQDEKFDILSEKVDSLTIKIDKILELQSQKKD